MSSAKAYTVSWFNLFSLPDMVNPSESMADFFQATHHYLAEALLIVTVIHVAAAFKHHFFDKDNVLLGMTGRKSWFLLAVTVLLTTFLFGRLLSSDSNQVNIEKTNNQNEMDVEFSNSDLSLWAIDYQDSFIKFTGDQAGAEFVGEWQQWQADIQFDSEQLSKARFNVTINPSSGFTQDQERDDTIRSGEFFDIAQFPNASYQASVFNKTDAAYEASGLLTMKGFSAPAVLSFEVIKEGSTTVLLGTASLDRLKWNIGSGDWADTSWVGQTVLVEVRVVKSNK